MRPTRNSIPAVPPQTPPPPGSQADGYLAAGRPLEIDRKELWILSYYRVSEIGGAMLFGKVARRIKDERLRVLLTRHFSDEARHAWLWTDAIVRVGGVPLDIPTTYQSRYGAEAGVPATELDLLAITQIFEKRVIDQYRSHQRRRGTHPVVADTLQQIMVDESWHLKWVKDELKRLEADLGRTAVAGALERYRAIDARVYAEVARHEHEPWKLFGRDEP
jgi:rubrerythrin